jgi:hypothetical protein
MWQDRCTFLSLVMILGIPSFSPYHKPRSWRQEWVQGIEKKHQLRHQETQVLVHCLLLFFFCSPGAWTQDLYLELLHPLYFCEGVFKIESCRTVCLGWPRTTIFLISASWVARITGVSHECWLLATSYCRIWGKSLNPSGLHFLFFFWVWSRQVIFFFLFLSEILLY